MYHAEGYEMKPYHKMVLTHTRMYLLHNLRPSEVIWSSLMEKDVLSTDMVEEIKGCGTNTRQVAALLDMLPARGPATFDAFCDTLLECDHVHAAEKLKTVEATYQFKEEIKRQAGSDLTDNQVERFVATFKRATPSMQRFAERKFEVQLEEREDEINIKESELQRLDATNTKLQLEVDHMKSFLSSFVSVTQTISDEVRQQVPSKHFLKEEISQLQNLQEQVNKSDGNSEAASFYKHMEGIVRFIEQHTDTIISAGMKEKAARREKSSIRLEVGMDVSLFEKLQSLVQSISGFIDDIVLFPSLPTDLLRTELQKVHKHAQNMADDVTLVNKKFRDVLKNKRKVETEVFSLLHNLKETRRLEREIKEKKNHISDLSKAGQLIRKKARSHRRELEQIQLNLTQKKLQMAEVQKALESHMNSADVRMHLLLRLLPDEACDTDSNPDTESFGGTGTPYSDDFRSLSGSLPRMKQNGEKYTLKTPNSTLKSSTQITPKATATTEKPESTEKISNPSGNNIGTNTAVATNGSEADKENKGDASPNAGQAYKSRMTIPKRVSRPGIAIPKPKGVKTSNNDPQQSSTDVSEDATSKKTPRGTDKPSTAEADSKTESDSNQRKVPTKRQYESSSESDSQSSGADSNSRLKWPQQSNQPAVKKSPRQPKEDGEAEMKDDAKEKLGAEKTKATNRLVTNSTRHNQYQYVLKGTQGRNSAMAPFKMPLGMSRDEYFQFLQTSSNPQAPLHSPMTIGGLNTASTREIPASVQTPAVRQPSSMTNKSEDAKREPRSPSNKLSNHREAFATKRVEPFFKLPSNGR